MSEREQPNITPAPARPRGPVRLLLDLFSSIWLGVFLLLILFIYCSVGSSGVPKSLAILRPETWVSVREVFELSEFEWFHWWPFDVLIALLCVNLVVATLRRIPFNVVNLGVWMIHTGIIILALGSVWYFSTKVEGDAPVARRRVVAALPGGETVSLAASPGNSAVIGEGDGTYVLRVRGITPDWELLSGDDKGKRAYKVSVLVQGPSQMFVRELLAGYPQYTEDLVPSDDPAGPPFARARKTLGTPLVDERLSLELDYSPQEYFCLREQPALYLRELGQSAWAQRPIEDLPRFGDYVASLDNVWIAPGDEAPDLDAINAIARPVDDHDPLPQTDLRIGEYLRYATMQAQRVPGGERIDPIASVRFDEGGRELGEFQLRAMDPARSALGDVFRFYWIDREEELEAIRAVRPPMLHIEVPSTQIAFDATLTEPAGGDGPFTEIQGTDFAWRVTSLQSNLVIRDRSVSLAVVEIRFGESEEDTVVRWVFDDPALTRDVTESGGMHASPDARRLDDRVLMTYTPGQRAGVRLVAGPGEDDLRMLLVSPSGNVAEHEVTAGEAVEIQPGRSVTITDYAARSRLVRKPMIVPKRRRDRNVGAQASMVRLDVPAADGMHSQWLTYHHFPFERGEDRLRRFPYQPTVFALEDGRRIEVLFSRRRMKLPSPVVLETFRIDTHIGGFTGETSSIRDWTSRVRFAAADGWSETLDVHMNHPVEHAGLWFFQSQWDAPDPQPAFEGDPGSAGLNYTILGVANRHGVMTQLFGCCLAVVGMMYAFYVKPAIKRRRQRAVMERLQAGEYKNAAPAALPGSEEEAR